MQPVTKIKAGICLLTKIMKMLIHKTIAGEVLQLVLKHNRWYLRPIYRTHLKMNTCSTSTKDFFLHLAMQSTFKSVKYNTNNIDRPKKWAPFAYTMKNSN